MESKHSGKPSTGTSKLLRDGEGKDTLGLEGVDHEGLVTERDIDMAFGLFTEEDMKSEAPGAHS
ncbi:hypothetical protein [Paenibacillus sp. HB172176]|uniref:hypothetical protein n=1 Tax=Paenibacillus sp. HB172176 TaxID=2493690 RepID=UPI001438B29E|nr:hypothetical protein [Paenibacillus sp. HB172176]